jgi:predicted  nucleic acid-binding Zn-ribbon protein
MLGFSTVPPSSPQEILEAAKKLVSVPAAKKYLADATDALAALDRQRVEFVNTQSRVAKQVAEERVALDGRAAELQKRADSLEVAEGNLAARIAQFERVVAELQTKLAGLGEKT